MVKTQSADTWFRCYSAAIAVTHAALAEMREGHGKSVKHSPSRLHLARCIRSERAIDRLHGACWSGQRYMRRQYGLAGGYTPGQF